MERLAQDTDLLNDLSFATQLWPESNAQVFVSTPVLLLKEEK